MVPIDRWGETLCTGRTERSKQKVFCVYVDLFSKPGTLFAGIFAITRTRSETRNSVESVKKSLEVWQLTDYIEESCTYRYHFGVNPAKRYMELNDTCGRICKSVIYSKNLLLFVNF